MTTLQPRVSVRYDGPARTNPVRIALALALALFGSASAAAQAQSEATTAASVAMCTPEQLSLGTDDENGAFHATSHSGTLLVLRNVSSGPCRIEPFAPISFRDRNGKALNVTVTRATPFSIPVIDGGAKVPVGHGPVALPLALAAGAEATSALRWVAGAPYGHAVCADPAFVTIGVGAREVRTTSHAHICASDATHLRVEAHRLVLDPTYSP